MTLDHMNREEIARLFISITIARRTMALNNIKSLLENGPPGQKPQKRLQNIYNWYQNLSSDEKKVVPLLLNEAIDTAIFSMLVFLDGSSGGITKEKTFSDFAVYLQTYESETDLLTNKPQTSIRFNTLLEGNTLHDLYEEILSEN